MEPYNFSISPICGFAFGHNVGTCFHELISTHTCFHELISTHLALKGLTLHNENQLFLNVISTVVRNGIRILNQSDFNQN